MTGPLWVAVDELTRPRHVRLWRDDGTTEWTTVPSLWWQLEDAAAGMGDAGGGAGSPSKYRSPGSIECLQLYYDVRDTVVDALTSYDRKPAMLTEPFHILVPESLRSLASVLITADDDLEWWAGCVRSWCRQIINVLRLTEQPPRRRIRDTVCPTCGAIHIRVDERGEPDPEGEFRVPALEITFNNRLVYKAACSACGSEWYRGDPLIALADLLAEQATHRNHADAIV
jgi:hypothetical protein